MDDKRTYIIAEAGVNHNGDPELARKLVDVAIEAGVDAVKFQTFKAATLVIHTAQKATYQKATTGNTETQYEMLSRLELSYQAHHDLYNYCKIKNIEFLSTAFDHDSLDFLVNSIGLTQLKIPSGDITNAPLILAHARTGADLIVSSGMSTLGEIEAALGVIAFGYMSKAEEKPCLQKFREAYCSVEGQKRLREKVTLLHCTSEYPAPVNEVNLRVITTLKSAFNLKTGYSDHTLGIAVPVAAVTCGAMVIEKHFTLDRAMEGPDHKASLEPDELKNMVDAIRDVEKALGEGGKRPQRSEIETVKVARKSLVTTEVVKKGERFSDINIGVKRPGTGMSPFQYWSVINGAVAQKDFAVGEVIKDRDGDGGE